MVFRRDKKIVLFLGILLVFLYSCGGGGGSDSSAPVKPPYDINLVKEKALTTDRWNQGNQKTAYGDGVYLVAFMDDRENFNALSGEDIWGAFVDTNLNVLSEFPILRRNGRDIHPFVIYDAQNKRFVIAWTAFKGIGSSSILMAFVTLDGKITVSEINIAQGFVEVFGLKRVSEGYALLFKDVWLTGGIDIGSKVMKVGVVNHDLEPVKVLAVTDDSYMGLKLDPTGASFDCIGDSCFIAYNMAKELFRDNSLHIYGRFVSLQDGKVHAEIKLSEDVKGKAASKTAPLVTAGRDSFFVNWSDWDSAQGLTSVDLVGKFVALSGSIGQEVLVSDFRWDKSKPITSGLGGMVYFVAVAYRPTEDVFYAIWSDSRSGVPLEPALFMRRINKDGNCIMVNNMPLGQKTVNVIVGHQNRLLATWSQAGVRQPHGHFSEDIFGAFLP